MDLILTELLQYVSNAGALAAPLFCLLFWLERNERKDAQRELKDIAKNTVVAISELKAVVNQLTMIFNTKGGR